MEVTSCCWRVIRYKGTMPRAHMHSLSPQHTPTFCSTGKGGHACRIDRWPLWPSCSSARDVSLPSCLMAWLSRAALCRSNVLGQHDTLAGNVHKASCRDVTKYLQHFYGSFMTCRTLSGILPSSMADRRGFGKTWRGARAARLVLTSEKKGSSYWLLQCWLTGCVT